MHQGIDNIKKTSYNIKIEKLSKREFLHMQAIQITADSTCDLSIEDIQKHQIIIQPLYINLGDKSFQDRVNIHPEDIFAYFDKEGKVPKTSAVTIQDYLDLFLPLVKQGRSVIHCAFSSALSSSFQNACTAATMLEEEGHPGEIHIVDTKSLCNGSGLVVLEACEMAENGISAAKIAQVLREEVVPKVEGSFIINTLVYLHKGGRCSSVAALGANLLKLKPCIELENGKMHVGKKYRASFDKCIPQYLHDHLEGRNDVNFKRIFITNASCDPAIVKKAREIVTQLCPFEEIKEAVAGSTISSHCGPGTFGIFFMKK